MTELIEGSKILQIIVVILICAAVVWAFFYDRTLDDDYRDNRTGSKQVKQIYPGCKGKDGQKSRSQSL